MNEELNITLKEGQDQLHIFHHQGPKAIDPKPPVQVTLDGSIQAPYLFLQNRKPCLETAIVTFNREVAKIRYFENPENPLSAIVDGSLVTHPDLSKFSIGTDCYFSKDEIRTLIRKNSHCFKDQNEAKNLDAKLRNFVAKVEESINLEDDEKGNSTAKAIRKVQLDSDLINSKTLLLPFFVGVDPQEIEVEINVHPTKLMFSFESWSFRKQFEESKKDLMNGVLSQLEALNLTIIEVY